MYLRAHGDFSFATMSDENVKVFLNPRPYLFRGSPGNERINPFVKYFLTVNVTGPLHPRLPQVSAPIRLVVAAVPMVTVLLVPREHHAQAHDEVVFILFKYDLGTFRRRYCSRGVFMETSIDAYKNTKERRNRRVESIDYRGEVQ